MVPMVVVVVVEVVVCECQESSRPDVNAQVYLSLSSCLDLAPYLDSRNLKNISFNSLTSDLVAYSVPLRPLDAIAGLDESNRPKLCCC